jgi:hypothetical protein
MTTKKTQHIGKITTGIDVNEDRWFDIPVLSAGTQLPMNSIKVTILGGKSLCTHDSTGYVIGLLEMDTDGAWFGTEGSPWKTKIFNPELKILERYGLKIQ